MTSSDDDEDLKRAIALSMQDEGSASQTMGHSLKDAIALDSETEDESDSQEFTKLTKETEHKSNEKSLAPSVGLGLLGLDRRNMEQERLARKRKVSISPPPPRKAPRIMSNIHVVSPTLVSQSAMNPTPKEASSGELQFPWGTIKKTWALGYPRVGDDIKLEEVLRKSDLIVAVLSSFQWDVEWLLAKIDTQNTQITMVMQAKDEATKQQYREEIASMSNLRLCFPSMSGQVNCMHSKLMLLSYPTHLRIVIPTANLVPYDWGESGNMENMLFLLDLPRLPDGQRTTPDSLTFFGRELLYFLEAMGLEQSVIHSMYSFDFAATKDLAFVHTIGGTHAGENDPWRRTGYCGLGRAIQELGLATAEALNIDFVTSSVGSLNIDFLTTLYLAAQGDDGTTEYQWRNPGVTKARSKQSKAAPKRAEYTQESLKDHVHKNFHIYFPTHETVNSSNARFAGTICFQSKWYNAPTFPRQTLRDCKSTREGLLMHNKIVYVSQKGEGDSAPWAYVGSANCSESAWGKLSKDRVLKSPKLNCRNWECGVVVPIRAKGKGSGRADLAQFEGTVPVPMQYPGDEYGNRKPWYYSEHYDG